MKPAAIVCEEILELLSKARGLTLIEITKETNTRDEDAVKILGVLVTAGLVIRNKDGTLAIDSGLREIVRSCGRS